MSESQKAAPQKGDHKTSVSNDVIQDTMGGDKRIVVQDFLTSGYPIKPKTVIQMQRMVGNTATQRILQRRTDTLLQRTPPSSTTAAPVAAAPVAVSRPVGVLNTEEQAFMNRMTEANARLTLAAGRFSQWLSAMTIPYARAWSAHRTALQEADGAAKQANALVIGTILAFVPGGLGGALGARVSRAMQGLSQGAAVVDGVKDLAKFGLRTAGAIAATPASLRGFAPDPLVWQNETNHRVELEVLNPSRAAIVEWMNKVNNHDPNFDYTQDPVAAINAAMHMNDGTSLFELTDPDSATLAQLYEQGFLRDWINTEAFPTYLRNSQFSWGKFSDVIEAYGRRIGWAEARQYLGTVVNEAVAENNRRAVASGHGLI